MLYDLSKKQNAKSYSPSRFGTEGFDQRNMAKSQDRAINNVIEGSEYGSSNKKIILSNVLTEIHKSLNDSKSKANFGFS